MKIFLIDTSLEIKGIELNSIKFKEEIFTPIYLGPHLKLLFKTQINSITELKDNNVKIECYTSSRKLLIISLFIFIIPIILTNIIYANPYIFLVLFFLLNLKFYKSWKKHIKQKIHEHVTSLANNG